MIKQSEQGSRIDRHHLRLIEKSTFSGVRGRLKTLDPVASLMAFERAAAIGTSAISLTPFAPNGPDFSKISTGTASISGASASILRSLHFGEGIDFVCGEIVDRHLS